MSVLVSSVRVQGMEGGKEKHVDSVNVTHLCVCDRVCATGVDQCIYRV